MPAHFEETRDEVLHQLIADHPLGTLVTLGADGLNANHIPFLLEAGRGEHGTLIGHVARNNHAWREVSGELQMESLVIFQGPSAYISPNWYETKRETHRVVPTYNYAVLHAYGRVIVHEDAKWLRGVVGKLTKRMEASLPVPWKMADAPADYLNDQLANIVGIEIPITRMVGKWKVSQNRPEADRAGAAAGLRGTGDPDDAAMADLVVATSRQENR
jgi:transcriptional regulator